MITQKHKHYEKIIINYRHRFCIYIVLCRKPSIPNHR